jgi:hypothetical protein
MPGSRPGVDRGVPGVGIGPISEISENDKAPTIYRPPNRSNTDAAFIRAFCNP